LTGTFEVPLEAVTSACLLVPVIALDGSPPEAHFEPQFLCKCATAMCARCTLVATLEVGCDSGGCPLRVVTSDDIEVVTPRFRGRLGFAPGIQLAVLTPGKHLDLTLYVRLGTWTSGGHGGVASSVGLDIPLDLEGAGWPEGVPPGATPDTCDPGTMLVQRGGKLVAPPGAEFAFVSPWNDPRVGVGAGAGAGAGVEGSSWTCPPILPHVWGLRWAPRAHVNPLLDFQALLGAMVDEVHRCKVELFSEGAKPDV
jgi:hypothetical protein